MEKHKILFIGLLLLWCGVLQCQGKGGRGSSKSSSRGGSHSNGRGSSSKSSRTSGSHSYPASTGLSGGGHAPSHTYPASGTGYSGNNGASRGSSSGSGRTRATLSSRIGYSAYLGSSSGTVHINSNQPQYVYVQHYQDTNSKYSDLLTGLTLYNMARSHHHHYVHHYYYDSFYRDRYVYQSQNTERDHNSESLSYEPPSERASCSLKITEKYSKTNVIKIPCEIVSTFTNGSEAYPREQVECEYDDDVLMPMTTTESTKTTTTTAEPIATTRRYYNFFLDGLDESIADQMAQNNKLADSLLRRDGKFKPSTTTAYEGLTTTDKYEEYTKSMVFGEKPSESIDPELIAIWYSDSDKLGSRFKREYDVDCINNATAVVNDGPLDLEKTCVVEIRTDENLLLHDVNCSEIMEFAKAVLVPQHDKTLLPSAEKIKTWVEHPPWWMSLFVAV